MAVTRTRTRNLPPSPQQGGCRLNQAIMILAGYSGLPAGASRPRQPPGPAAPGPAAFGAGRPRASSRRPAGQGPDPASGPGLPAFGGIQAGRRGLALCWQRRAPRPGPAFTGNRRIRAPAGLKRPVWPPWRLAPRCVLKSPTPRQRARDLVQRGHGLVQVGHAQQQRTRGPPPRRAAHRDSGECSGRVPPRSLSWGSADLRRYIRPPACSAEHRVQRSTKPQTRTPRASPYVYIGRARRLQCPPAPVGFESPLCYPSRKRMADGGRCHAACAQRLLHDHCACCMLAVQQPSIYP